MTLIRPADAASGPGSADQPVAGSKAYLPALRLQPGPAPQAGLAGRLRSSRTGNGSPGDQDSVVDLFQGPDGVEAFPGAKSQTLRAGSPSWQVSMAASV